MHRPALALNSYRNSSRSIKATAARVQQPRHMRAPPHLDGVQQRQMHIPCPSC